MTGDERDIIIPEWYDHLTPEFHEVDKKTLKLYDQFNDSDMSPLSPNK